MTPIRLDLRLERGADNPVSFMVYTDNGYAWWTPSGVHVAGDVVKVAPDVAVLVAAIVSPNGRTLLQPTITTPGLFLRCTTGGTSSSASPAVPTVPGTVVTDGGVTWVVQTDSVVPIDTTSAIVDAKMRPAPDDTGPATLGIDGGLWTGATNGLLSAVIAAADVETLLAAWSRGAWDVLVTIGGVTTKARFGVVEIVPTCTR